ncbi:Uma2 family endonuclease [Streptomyces oceani]|uniref:Putative restriction endonuclease domain-containing protein n=1 Tax=Streptomyces oceani TaxID=1075402 RepID=A0A1E7KHG7_9ACTN|nr:Uma2 family endonuclease [Streptomyces oceani]OEV03388.1 hypothetical protein AN216_11775 [Streptomyces oceani]
MTIAPERPRSAATEETGTRLMDLADAAAQAMPGSTVEVLGGQLIVTPGPDGPHGESLTALMEPLMAAKLHRGETRVIQNLGLWLPTGDDDHAVPDLAVVDADYREHEVRYKCYDPAPFRLIVEITSSNWREDLDRKPRAYAEAGVPGYVIGDRQHERVIVYSDPHDGTYRTRSDYKPGETVTLPAVLGIEVTLAAGALLIS